MTTENPAPPPENPSGSGPAPADPWKGFRGITAGILVLEAITIGLVLTVITRVDDGSYSDTWRVVYVSALAIAMVVAAGLQRRPWGMTLNLTLVALAVVGFVVHWSMGVVGLVFAVVWAFLLWTRGQISRRMESGTLPSQHV